MPRRTAIREWSVLALAAALTVVVWGPLSGKEKSAAGADDMVPVLVADRYIPAFTIIDEKMAAVRHFPKSYVPPGPLHAIRELLSEADRALYISAVAIPEGAPLTHTLLDELGKSRGMASILPPGKGAISFAADPVRAAGGWVEPGDTIAIFSTSLDAEKGNSSRKTKLIFSAMVVLAVDKSRLGSTRAEPRPEAAAENPEPGPTVITVLANPLDAARLVQAREQGHLSVVLRSLGDDAPWVGL